ncbi:MAG: DNA methyltransferase [Tractidigestivibacter sp.]|uniref:DNA methyltransferase n=1 Tax=Tractidigestivibacter sp. TaxID=2847320 RepID=UPI003D8EFE3B
MPETSQSAVERMVERATKLGDPILAQDIRAFAAERQFGLVFEHNRPERMRLYGKPITTRDIVQVLPKRGGEEGPESKLLWRVASIDGEDAKLTAYRTTGYTKNNNSDCEAKLCDLVAVAEYDQPIYAGLEEVDRVERGGDSPYHVVINGENYHALEMLEFCYAGKVDCIYIDPPYNTGAKDWKYNNDYVDGSDQYRHSKWLAFMERRLKLAKQLLNPEDSVLIVTIDEKERDRLGLLLEQLFPDTTRQMVTIVSNPKGSTRDRFSRVEENAFFCFIGDASIRGSKDSLLGEVSNNGGNNTPRCELAEILRHERALASESPCLMVSLS